MIKIILLEKVLGIGILGDIVSVKSGYARNFLIPNGKAIPATDINIKYFSDIKNKIKLEIEQKYKFSKDRAKVIDDLKSIQIKGKVTKKGKLFGSINKSDIISYFNNIGIKLYRNEIILDKLIRKIGNYNLIIKLHPKVKVKLLMEIIPDI